jgi:eukaryotic-like serine/threonine-protein kinase
VADSTPSEPASSFPLAPKLLAEAARRLGWIWLAVAVLCIATFFFQRLAQPEMALVLDDPVIRLLLLGIVLLAIGLLAAARQRLVPAATLLTLGMVFEVAVAFVISMVETSLPFEPDRPVIGVSSVGPLVFAMGVLVPNRPVLTLITALVAASMWPLAYVANAQRLHFEVLAWGRVLVWPVSNYGMAILAYLVGRRTYGSEIAMQQAHELGSYELIAPIGHGGMGEVWKATHKMLARDAAVKLVRRGMIERISSRQAEIAIKRFRREATATARLQSPHTVYLYDFGLSEDGHFYYAMELLDGITLQTLVSTFGPQPVSRVVAILRQICESLEEAHVKELVHRDLKPSNVMLCKVALEYDFVKVLDFGLVKPLEVDGQSRLTVEGVFGGTAGYVAPEVALGERHVDGRADIYAVGCIAYYLLTGTPVFNDGNAAAVAIKHLNVMPDPPSRRSELAIPACIDRVVLQCLAKRRDDRPETARGLADLLDACGVTPWTPAEAAAWWQLHLPPTCALRTRGEAPSAERHVVRKA